MFITPEQLGLSQSEIDKIVEKLWKEREDEENTCPDCGISPGKTHDVNCDVARCLKCGYQALSCECDEPENDVWTGLWPGIKECYEQKIIAYDTCYWPDTKTHIGWQFDLNELVKKINERIS